MKKYIVYYEGLGGIFMNTLKRGLIKDIKPFLEKKYPDDELVFEQRYWTNKKLLHQNTILVIGHSFGGHAAMEAVKKVTHGVRPRIVTIDPRFMPKTWFNSPNQYFHLNFYQPKMLEGKQVTAAKNIRLVQSTRIPFRGHMTITRDKRLIKNLKRFVN